MNFLKKVAVGAVVGMAAMCVVARLSEDLNGGEDLKAVAVYGSVAGAASAVVTAIRNTRARA